MQCHQIDAERTKSGNQAANHATDQTDCTGLAQKGHANVTHITAKRLHDADFTRSFRYRHDHRIGDADGGHQERNAADTAQRQLNALRLLLDLPARLLEGRGLVPH